MEYAYLQLGYAYSMLKKWSDQVGVFKKMVEYFPDNGDAWLNMGIGYMQIKQWAPAVEPLEKAVELNPSSGVAYYNLAVCHLNLHNNMEAREIWRKLQSIDADLASKLQKILR
jgi:tetratricopeptide (TPR) repeat protein